MASTELSKTKQEKRFQWKFNFIGKFKVKNLYMSHKKDIVNITII